MALTSTIISETEIRGGVRVVFQHANGGGKVFGPFVEQRPAGSNLNTYVANHAVRVEGLLKQSELQENLANALSDDPPNVKTIYSTNTENGLFVREAFKVSKGRDAYRLCWWVDSFNLTDNQLRVFFGLTVEQLPTIKAKIADYAAKYETMTEAIGE